jgi:hypothetical protein
MSSSHDPFSARFDTIEIDPARAPSAAALESAMAAVAPAEGPGFYLLDDAGGRFVVDREMGIISLKDDAILETQRFDVHPARLLVIERSGARYEMEMRLRLTGHVPQMLGAEDSSFLLDLAAGDTPQAAPAAAAVVEAIAAKIEKPVTVTPWTLYSAAHAAPGKGQLIRTRRAFIAQDLPSAALESAALSIAGPLPEVGSNAPWSL